MTQLAVAAPSLPTSAVRPTGWLKSLGANWPAAVCRLLETGPAVVRVLIAEKRGSAPREAGACMLVTGSGIEGTVGGGNLEYQALELARPLLMPSAAPAAVHRLILGRELAQCCGGVVQLWIERFTRADLPLLQLAAREITQHGSALIEATLSACTVSRRLINDAPGATSPDEGGNGSLAAVASPGASSIDCKHPQLPPRISSLGEMIEPAEASKTSERQQLKLNGNETGIGAATPRVRLVRSGEQSASLLELVEPEGAPVWLYGAGHVGQAIVRALAELPFRVTWIDSRTDCLPAALPDNVRALHVASPVETVNAAPAGCHFLVLTHDHALDYALCRAILTRNDFAWAGLIGSESKGARFRSRLRRDSFSPESIVRLVCPIGIAGIESKLPAAIAIAVAAQLLQNVTASQHASSAPGSEALAASIAFQGIACKGAKSSLAARDVACTTSAPSIAPSTTGPGALQSASSAILLRSIAVENALERRADVEASEHDCAATDCASCRRGGA